MVFKNLSFLVLSNKSSLQALEGLKILKVVNISPVAILGPSILLNQLMLTVQKHPENF